MLGVLVILGTVAACAYDFAFAARFAAFLLLSAFVLTAAWRIAATLLRRAHPSEVLLAAATTSAVIVVLTVLLLGLIGWLNPWTVLGAHAVTWLAVRLACHPATHAWALLRSRLFHRREPHAAYLAKLLCLVTVLAAGGLGIFRPKANYDAIGYHLTAAATWLQEGRVRLVPTPFGANGQAYMPANVNLIQTWLMLPFGDDTLARASQFPFLGVCMLGVYVMARNLIRKRRWAVLAPALLLLCRHLLVQSGSAMVDVATAAFVLSALGLCLTFARTGNLFAIVCAGLALGLAIGSKFPVLAMLPVLVPLMIVWAWPALRKPPAAAITLFLVAVTVPAVYWYARNAALTGNPLYPMRLSLAGHIIFDGAFDAELMRHWLFNRSTHPDLVTAITEVFTPILGQPLAGPLWLAFLALPALWLIGLLQFITIPGAKRVPACCLFLAVPALLAIQWFWVPYQEPRFFFTVFGLLCAGIAVVASASQAFRFLAAALLIAHLLICARWYAMLVPLLVVGSVALLALPLLRALARRRLSWLLAALACWWPLALFGPPEQTRRYAFAHQPRFRAAWTFGDANIDRARVGYAGHNIPYFLFGPRLQNRVMPVNTDEHTDFAFHDYAALDNAMTRARPNTPEAAYYRATLDQRSWLGNIRRLNLNYLVISTVAENQMLTIRHDEDGFPIEARWAGDAPEVFALEHEDEHTRIYRIDSTRLGSLLDEARERQPRITRAEPDCFTLRMTDPLAYAELYPWAEARIDSSPRLQVLVSWLERRDSSSP
ncbi:MAG: phospholipid carrier-dependent glycosyltransferase [Phycisphaerales bacterium]|nr:MAG: phospholipid carrier-dependent glycosyltransferase [Phycisphaerales bacterium]